MDKEAERVTAVFMPHAVERAARVKEKKIDFVHYTTAENALNIFRSQQVWLRSTLSMNDYREFNHGLDFLIDYFHNTESKKEFFEAVDACAAGLAEEAIKLFDAWLPQNRMSLYVACVSEHDPKEDLIGRLSMWRACTRPGSAGVALVLDHRPFFLESDVLQAWSSPVSYLGADNFRSEIERVVGNIRRECELLKKLPRERLIASIFNMLLFAAACSKHAGFEEEREWRIIHAPKIFPSKVLECTIETLGGIPQLVYKIPLRDMPERGLIGIEIPKLLKRVIIGPSNAPWQLYEAFVAQLNLLGVDSAEQKVTVSDIPLRPN